MNRETSSITIEKMYYGDIQSVFKHFAGEFLQTFAHIVSLDNDQEYNENGNYFHKRKNFETHYSCAYVAIYT